MNKRKNFDIDPYFAEAAITLEVKREERRQQQARLERLKNHSVEDFLSKKRNLSDSSFFPDGDEDIMLAIYIIVLPYLAGLGFVFVYICKWSLTRIFDLSEHHSFFLLWAIGYEVLAILTLIWIGKTLISSFFTSRKYQQEEAKRR